VLEDDIRKVERCCTTYRAIGAFDRCDCEPQIHPEHCGKTSLCVKDADRERRKLTCDMVRHIQKVYEVAGEKLRVSNFEFTIPDSEAIFIENDLKLAREKAVETVYAWYGYDSKKVRLAVDTNADIWHSDRIWAGFHPHFHLCVYSWVEDVRTRLHSFSEKIGRHVPNSELGRLRFLWKRNIERSFHFSSSAPNFVVYYRYIDEARCGRKRAYAQLSFRLRYMYRLPVIDVRKFLTNMLIGSLDREDGKKYPTYWKKGEQITEVVPDVNHAWVGRLLNFYGRSKRGESGKFKHVQRFGLLADRVQKKYGNELAKQHSKEPNFKSPSERIKESRSVRCKRHPLSRGEILQGCSGMSLEEAKRKFPRSRFVGSACDIGYSEFWKEA